MKLVYILISCLIILHLCGCENKEPKSYNFTLESIQAKSDFYCIASPPIEELSNRCDKLTFHGMFDAFCRRSNIYDHEWNPGEWHRDYKECYPDDSRSEISTEGILSALIAMFERGDYDKIQDFWDYMERNDWVAGVGPEKYTKMLQLKALIKEIMEKHGIKLQNHAKVLRYAAESSDSSIGYRGNVLAFYIFIHGYSLGYIESWHLKLLKELAKEVPQSPFYQALVGCYDWSENYQIALNILGDEEMFPSDRIPENINEGLWDWSDSPQIPLFAMTRRVLEHCHE